jgi:hypothetical protein
MEEKGTNTETQQGAEGARNGRTDRQTQDEKSKNSPCAVKTWKQTNSVRVSASHDPSVQP